MDKRHDQIIVSVSRSFEPHMKPLRLSRAADVLFRFSFDALEIFWAWDDGKVARYRHMSVNWNGKGRFISLRRTAGIVSRSRAQVVSVSNDLVDSQNIKGTLQTVYERLHFKCLFDCEIHSMYFLCSSGYESIMYKLPR